MGEVLKPVSPPKEVPKPLSKLQLSRSVSKLKEDSDIYKPSLSKLPLQSQPLKLMLPLKLQLSRLVSKEVLKLVPLSKEAPKLVLLSKEAPKLVLLSKVVLS